MQVRPATEADVARVAEITIEAYVGDGLVGPESSYVQVLGDAATRLAARGLLVAEVDGVVAGSVLFAPHGSRYSEVAEEGAAEFRMLAVAKEFRGRGVGAALVRECIAAAIALGCPTLRLSTQMEMEAARRLYVRMGFLRTEERDWEPIADVHLITYALALDAYDDGAAELEPPRRCTICGRRMVVQVTPNGWTAECSVHGVRRS